jgi:hypothetical protein
MTLWMSSSATSHTEPDPRAFALPVAAQAVDAIEPVEAPPEFEAWRRHEPRPSTDYRADTASPGTHDRRSYAARYETPSQRLDRNYGKILQDVRGAQTGVQLLLAFLLTLAFTPRFDGLTEFQRNVYVTSLILGAAANALLIAPAPFHRLVFQRRLKRRLVRAASRFALFGLTLLMLALTSSLLLILDIVIGTDQAKWMTAGTLVWFGLWWFAAPLWSRRSRRRYDHSMAALGSGIPAHRIRK